MDKFEALQAFWESFGIPAYDENTVPTGDDRPEFPYITYSAAVSDFFGAPAALTASIWDYGTTWARIAQKADEIHAELSAGGKQLPVDGGTIWFKSADPKAQRMADPDDQIRRLDINVEANFHTSY